MYGTKTKLYGTETKLYGTETDLGLNLLKQVPTIINWQGILRPKNKEGQISIKIINVTFVAKLTLVKMAFCSSISKFQTLPNQGG